MKTDKAVNTNHTPGPWEVIEAPEGTRTFFRVQSGGGLPIARVSHYIADDGEYIDGGEANARLIAAAPDLLDALKNAVKVLERKAPDSLDLIEARAAILRAEGGK